MKRIALSIGTGIAFVLFCFGCDGICQYSYTGTLFQHDGKTPATNVPVQITAEPTVEFHPESENLNARTDESGRFKGSFITSSSWIFVIRPAAPRLDSVYLLMPSTRPAKIDLGGVDEKTTSYGRDIVLPPIVLAKAAGASD